MSFLFLVNWRAKIYVGNLNKKTNEGYYMVWYSVVCNVMVWCGVVCYGMVYGTPWYCTLWCAVVWCGIAWFSVVWNSVIHCVMQYGCYTNDIYIH